MVAAGVAACFAAFRARFLIQIENEFLTRAADRVAAKIEQLEEGKQA